MKKSLIAVLVFLLASTSMSFAQSVVDTSFNVYDFDFVGGGTRAKGMGNAFIGVSNDITGGSWNPAGMFELDETTMAISWLSMSPKGNSSVLSSSDLTESTHAGSLNDISSLNFASPMRISGHPFVFSLNLTRNFTTFKQYNSFVNFLEPITTDADNGVVYYDTNNVDIYHNVSAEGSLNSINLGFGTRMYDNYSFGASVNIYTGKSLKNRDSLMSIDDYRIYTVQFASLDSNVFYEDTNKFSGVNFTLGFMYNGDKLNAGMTVRTPFKLRETREQGEYRNTDINGMTQETDTIFTSDLYKYEMPLMIGAGVGYQATEKLLLAGDIEYRGFSGKKVDFRISQTINPGSSNIEEFITLDPKWESVLSVRLGTEYMNDFSFGDIPLRFGLSFIPTPNPAEDGQKIYASFGTGVHFEKIKFDFAYSYVKSSTLDLGIEQNFKNHNIDVSFTGVF